MKVVVVITGLHTGGAEMMLLKVLERLGARFSPHIISLTTIGDIGLRIRALGIPVDSLGMRSGLPSPSALWRLAGRIKTLRPDVVHTWMYHADLLGGLAARLAHVPAVAWGIRNTNLDRDKTKLTTRFVVATCAKLSSWVPDLIMSCSEVAREVHVERGYAANKIRVVPNGFDLARFQPDGPARASVRAELRLGEGTPLVGLVGRFDPLKGHVAFFEAVGRLHRRLPAVHYVLAGNGIDEGNRELLRVAEDAGVRGVTHFLGLRSDIPRLMSALDVLVSSSYGEAFPNVLGEAMACGVPCAVTDAGDSAYIVGDTGAVVMPGDVAGLAVAMERLLLLPTPERAALGQRARARVAELFEIGHVVRRYESFYEELAECGHRNRRTL